VLIVGAGISGLSCGYHLNALVKDNPDANIQLHLKIVDARDDVGGRTQSVTDAAFITEAGLDLDMGGQDLFFGDQDQYAALLTDDDQEKFRNFRESFPTVSYSPVSGCESAINNVRDDCEASMFNFDEPSKCTENKNDNYCVCAGNPPDSDVDIDGIVCNRTPSSLTAIANTRDDDCNEWCAKYVTGDTVTTCSENGGFYCNQNEEFPRDNRNASFADASLGTFVKEFFYEPLKEAKEVEVKFKLNTQIEKIRYDKKKVKADWTKANGNTGTFNADHLVVAVPKTQIQDSTKLKFEPDLDPKFRAKFEGSRVIPGVRIWVEFETKFYDTVTDFPDGGARYWDAVKGYDTDRNIVTIQGNRNTALTNMTDIELRNLLIEDMDAAYNNAASENFDYTANKFYVRNYAKEEFIEMSTGDEDIDFRNTEFSVEGTSLGLVDGRIWFIGDYYANFDDNTSAESGKLAAQKIWEKITS